MKSFKNRAADKQLQFIAGKTEFAEYQILEEEDALRYQLVPWEGLIDEIEKRRKIKDKSGKVKMPFRNMLRSEHIPYNLFIPLKLSKNQSRVISFFQKLLQRNDLLGIKMFEIEWAPIGAINELKDKTSFDTYIQFELNDAKKLGVGIEVKFTEKSYPFTKTESLRLSTEDDSSPYYKFWNNTGASIYKDDSYQTLGKKEFKQFFRNHLLGLSMIGHKNTDLHIDEFISIHLYPSGNEYQSQKSKGYRENIKSEYQQYFRPITFEEFIENLNSIYEKEIEYQDWLKYLEARYVIQG